MAKLIARAQIEQGRLFELEVAQARQALVKQVEVSLFQEMRLPIFEVETKAELSNNGNQKALLKEDYHII